MGSNPTLGARIFNHIIKVFKIIIEILIIGFMPSKRRILNRLQKEVKNQEKERFDLENSERITSKKLDPVNAPGVDSMEELRKKWKYQETGRELGEEGSFTNEGDVETEEEAGQEPYPEIETDMKDPDEEDEEDKS